MPPVRLLRLALLSALLVAAPAPVSAADGPALSDLRIEGAGVAWGPAFAPALTHYAVYPETEGAALTITPTSSADIAIDGAPATSGQPFDVPSPEPGDRIAITLTEAGQQTTYTVLYLTEGFPRLEATTYGAGLAEGEVAITLQRRPDPGPPYFMASVDRHGTPTRFIESDRPPQDFKRHPNGMYTYAERSGELNEFGRESRTIVVLDADLEEVGRHRAIGLNHTDGHDFLILPNGHFVFLSYNGEMRGGQLFEDSVIQVVDPSSGTVVFEWNSRDHGLYPDRVRDRAEYAHVNSVVVDTDGSYLASFRGTGQVIKIDAVTGDVVWKLGGVSSDFTTDDPWGGFCGQHTATRLDNGNLLVFDNGNVDTCPDLPAYAGRTNRTRVVEYRLNESAFTAELVWSYEQPGYYSRAAGSSLRLSNGNTLVGWGNNEAALATEVGPDGTRLWELASPALPDGAFWSSYRAGFVADEPMGTGTEGPGPGAAVRLSAPYPSPAGRSATLDLSGDAGAADVRVTLHDALGRAVRVVYDGAVAPGRARPLTVDVSALPAGVYWVVASSDRGRVTRRLVVVR